MKKNNIPNWFWDDGCSCYPDGNRKEACRIHDFEYWLGGTGFDKETADLNLFTNVNNLDGFFNKWFHSWVMFLGVKIWGKRPFVERSRRLNPLTDDLLSIYKKERPEQYMRRINYNCKIKA